MGAHGSMECRHGRNDHSRTLRALGVASRLLVDRFSVYRGDISRHHGSLCLRAGVCAGAGLDAVASCLEPSLCLGQCRASGESGNRDHGRDRHRRHGDCHGVAGGTVIAPPNTGQSTGRCSDILLYRHPARSSAGVRVAHRSTDRPRAPGTDAAGAFAAPRNRWTCRQGRRRRREGRQARGGERGAGETVVFHP